MGFIIKLQEILFRMKGGHMSLLLRAAVVSEVPQASGAGIVTSLCLIAGSVVRLIFIFVLLLCKIGE